MKFKYLTDASLMASSASHRLEGVSFDTHTSVEKSGVGAHWFVGLNVMLAVTGGWIGVSAGNALQVSPPLPVSEQITEMTYQGMDLEAFAIFIGLPADDPYTIAAFEDMCMAEKSS